MSMNQPIPNAQAVIGRTEDAVTLSIPTTGLFKAENYLPARINKSEIRNGVVQFVRSPELTVPTFIALVSNAGTGHVQGLNGMLENVKARDIRPVGDAVIAVIQNTTNFTKRMPKVDPRLQAKVDKGDATLKEIVNWIKYFAGQIDKYRRGYQSILELVEEKRNYLYQRYNLSLEAAVRDWLISKEENDRELALLVLTYRIEVIKEELGNVLAGKLEDDERERYMSVKPLIEPRLATMRLLVQAANLSAKRFASQSQSNGLTAMKYNDLAGPGVENWKANIASRMDAIVNVAENIALSGVDEFLVQAAEDASSAYLEQMASMRQLLTTQSGFVKEIESTTDALVLAGTELLTAMKVAEKNGVDVQRVIEDSRNKVKDLEKKMQEGMAR